ncbi:hypothetical protein Saa2_04113 [Streptomyces acidiscabies]|nr:hypothetical protein Saa2_04113 [Streptomyces acidiscabies]
MTGVRGGAHGVHARRTGFGVPAVHASGTVHGVPPGGAAVILGFRRQLRSHREPTPHSRPGFQGSTDCGEAFTEPDEAGAACGGVGG